MREGGDLGKKEIWCGSYKKRKRNWMGKRAGRNDEKKRLKQKNKDSWRRCCESKIKREGSDDGSRKGGERARKRTHA